MGGVIDLNVFDKEMDCSLSPQSISKPTMQVKILGQSFNL
jgi:hypothetical protein